MITRRCLLQTLPAAMAAQTAEARTEFQIACMSLPYQASSFRRAVQGIAQAGFRYIAWGPNTTDASGRRAPLLADHAPASAAVELAKVSRDAGLEPVLMFGAVYPERPEFVETYKHRIEQAHAAGIPNILCFGSPQAKPEEYAPTVRSLRAVAPIAKQAGITIGVKQHGGITATGRMTARVIAEVAHESVRLFYDAGNVWWYTGEDANIDFAACGAEARGFAIKDFRAAGKLRATCGPGFGQTDHYKMLSRIARAGGKIPLAFENISQPFTARPNTPEDVDALARRAREYMETVVAGVHAAAV
ncbi:MAG: TIM barrel protein [Candidatus Solibacter usitatus]|nr:TIM barrel protein [Candidatus Solibacter usitatus]